MKNEIKGHFTAVCGFFVMLSGIGFIVRANSSPCKDILLTPPPIIQQIHNINNTISSLEYETCNLSYYAKMIDTLPPYNSGLEAITREIVENKMDALNEQKDSLIALPNYNEINKKYEEDFKKQKRTNRLTGISLLTLSFAGMIYGFYKVSQPDKTKKT